MRLLPLSLLFGAAATALAAAVTNDDEFPAVLETTHFNGIAVPPMLELSPETWEQEMNNTKFLMVKFFR